MRKLAMAVTVLGAMGSAAAAAAAVGQCYDAYGRPVGPAYNSDHPDHALIHAVTRAGGRCVIVAVAPPGGARHARDPALSGHADWCGSIPPSGYCITRDRR